MSMSSIKEVIGLLADSNHSCTAYSTPRSQLQGVELRDLRVNEVSSVIVDLLM